MGLHHLIHHVGHAISHGLKHLGHQIRVNAQHAEKGIHSYVSHQTREYKRILHQGDHLARRLNHGIDHNWRRGMHHVEHGYHKLIAHPTEKIITHTIPGGDRLIHGVNHIGKEIRKGESHMVDEFKEHKGEIEQAAIIAAAIIGSVFSAGSSLAAIGSSGAMAGTTAGAAATAAGTAVTTTIGGAVAGTAEALGVDSIVSGVASAIGGMGSALVGGLEAIPGVTAVEGALSQAGTYAASLVHTGVASAESALGLGAQEVAKQGVNEAVKSSLASQTAKSLADKGVKDMALESANTGLGASIDVGSLSGSTPAGLGASIATPGFEGATQTAGLVDSGVTQSLAPAYTPTLTAPESSLVKTPSLTDNINPDKFGVGAGNVDVGSIANPSYKAPETHYIKDTLQNIKDARNIVNQVNKVSSMLNPHPYKYTGTQGGGQKGFTGMDQGLEQAPAQKAPQMVAAGVALEQMTNADTAYANGDMATWLDQGLQSIGGNPIGTVDFNNFGTDLAHFDAVHNNLFSAT